MCPERHTGIILPSRKLVSADGLGQQTPQRLQKNHYPLRESALPRDHSRRILQTEGRGKLTDVQSHTLVVHSPQAVLFYSRLAFPQVLLSFSAARHLCGTPSDAVEWDRGCCPRDSFCHIRASLPFIALKLPPSLLALLPLS